MTTMCSLAVYMFILLCNDVMFSTVPFNCIYAATTHNTRLEMKGAKIDDVCLLMKCDRIFGKLLLTGNLKTL